MQQRVYMGIREKSGTKVFRLINGKITSLPLCLDLRNHSPDGFNWGYGGSGPSQLALALCVDVLFSRDVALDVYQLAKGDLLRGMKFDAWILTERHVRTLLTPHLQNVVHCFPLGVWARALEKHSQDGTAPPAVRG